MPSTARVENADSGSVVLLKALLLAGAAVQQADATCAGSTRTVDREPPGDTVDSVAPKQNPGMHLLNSHGCPGPGRYTMRCRGQFGRYGRFGPQRVHGSRAAVR